MKLKHLFVFFPATIITNTIAENLEIDCNVENLIVSPAPEAPRVTELEPGGVTLGFSVNKQGEVQDIKVLETTGDPRWTKSFIKALKQRKYEAPNKSYYQVCNFAAEFDK